MKKFGIIGTLFVLILFVVFATQSTFKTVKENENDDLIRVALVNEDVGVVHKGVETNFAREFFTLLENDKQATYTTVTRSVAMLGLENNKYDVMIVATKDFSKNISEYDSKDQAAALLEYEVTKNSSRIQYLNSVNLVQMISAKLNQAAIELYTKEVMTALDNMKFNSINNLNLQQDYQKNFTKNVTAPVQQSMVQINNIMNQVNVNNAFVDDFGESVKRFKEMVANTNTKELLQLDTLKRFSEANQKNINSVIATNELIDKLNNLAKTDKATTLQDLYNLLLGNELSLQDIINQMKVDSLNLEIGAKDVENRALKEIVYPLDIYKKLKVEVEKEINSNNTYTFDVSKIDVSNIPVEDQEAYRQKAAEVYGNAVLNSDSFVNKILNSQVFITKILDEIQINQPLKVKDAIELEITNACNVLPYDIKTLPAGVDADEYAAAIRYCQLSEIQKDPSPIADEKIPYVGKVESTFTLDQYETFELKLAKTEDVSVTIINTSTLEEVTYTNKDTAPVISNATDTKIDYTITITTTKPYTYVDGTILPTTYPNFTPMNFEGVIKTYDDQNIKVKETKLSWDITVLDSSIRITSAQQLALDNYHTIQVLSKLYYGDTIKNVVDLADTNGFGTHTYFSDEKVDIEGVKKFRTILHPDNSLISRLEKRIDREELGKEIVMHMLDIYITEVTKQDELVKNYLKTVHEISNLGLNIGSIYNEDGSLKVITVADIVAHPEWYNSSATGTNASIIVRLIEKEVKVTSTVSKYKTFYDNFNTNYIPTIDKLDKDSKQVVTDLNETNQFAIQLNETQIELLKGIGDLDEQVNVQLKEIADVLAEMERLKALAGTATSEVESYQGLVDESKVAFDEITAENETFVDDFVSKYVASKIGGQENEAFYKKFAKPVETSIQNPLQDKNQIVPFFVIFLLSMFALIVAYFFSQMKFKAKADSELEHANTTKSIIETLSILVLASILIGALVSFVTVSLIEMDAKQTIPWIVLIMTTMLTLTVLYYFLLLNAKTIGLIMIAAMMVFYFITNGALGLLLVESSLLSTVQALNPLGLFETPLLQILSNDSIHLVQTMFIQFVVIIVAVVLTFVIHNRKPQLETTV